MSYRSVRAIKLGASCVLLAAASGLAVPHSGLVHRPLSSPTQLLKGSGSARTFLSKRTSPAGRGSGGRSPVSL